MQVPQRPLTPAERGPKFSIIGENIKQEWTAKMGMMVFIASWFVMFSALFFIYVGLRSKASEWPPLGMPRLPLYRPMLNTFIVLFSSFSLEMALHNMKKGYKKKSAYWGLGAVVLGTLFIALQFMVWWEMYSTWKLTLQTGVYGGTFYAFTVFHAAHVLVGLAALAFITWNLYFNKNVVEKINLKLKLWTMYWHFVGVLWICLFLILFYFGGAEGF